MWRHQHCTVKGHGGAAFFFIFPLQTAHQHLDPDSPEGFCLEEIMESIVGDKHRFEIGRGRGGGQSVAGRYIKR